MAALSPPYLALLGLLLALVFMGIQADDKNKEAANWDATLSASTTNEEDRQERSCKPKSPYRFPDDRCNNLNHPDWGTPMQSYFRWLPSEYDGDGTRQPRLKPTGVQLPSSRAVSLACNAPRSHQDLDPIHTHMVMQWGQFFVHDLVGTPTAKVKNCCNGMRPDGSHPDYETNGPCFPIAIPRGDHHFKATCMEFVRSKAAVVDGKLEQINKVTAALDGSAVYGSTKLETDRLRLFHDGLMATTEDDMLPYTKLNQCFISKSAEMKSCYDAGDDRVNVFPGLTITHALWVREHNRLAEELQEMHSEWDDETIFQETRRIVIAMIQKITYEDYLPKVIGETFMKEFGLRREFQYNAILKMGVFNSFVVAAGRFGHSQIATAYPVLTKAHRPIDAMYFRPYLVAEDDGKGFDAILDGLLTEKQPKTDMMFSPGVSDLLFRDFPRPGTRRDLVAFNIQRGRDHGVPGYLKFARKALKKLAPLGLTPAIAVPPCTDKLYKNPESVDLYVGAMSEQPVRGGMVGPTFATILAEQFSLLRSADRFFYQTQDKDVGFTPAQLKALETVTLTKVICANSNLDHVQRDAFLVHSSSNPYEECDDTEVLSLTPWKT